MDDVEKFAMENCVMLLSTKAAADAAAAAAAIATTSRVGATINVSGRKYTCKTKDCGREFDSFQALGGHRASHNKLKLVNGGGGGGDSDVAASMTPAKQKSHACSICGAEFPIGQALGGHMRRHRPLVTAVSGGGSSIVTNDASHENSDANNNNNNNNKRRNEEVLGGEVEHVEKRLRVEEVCLDLNLGFLPWVKKEKSEIVEQETVKEEEEEEDDDDDESDFLKLELRPSIRV